MLKENLKSERKHPRNHLEGALKPKGPVNKIKVIELKEKKQLNLCPFYDLPALEEHFSKMAEKGWQFKKINGPIITYETGNPEKKKYLQVVAP